MASDFRDTCVAPFVLLQEDVNPSGWLSSLGKVVLCPYEDVGCLLEHVSENADFVLESPSVDCEDFNCFGARLAGVILVEESLG